MLYVSKKRDYWVYENLVHIFDYNSNGTYTFIYNGFLPPFLQISGATPITIELGISHVNILSSFFVLSFFYFIFYLYLFHFICFFPLRLIQMLLLSILTANITSRTGLDLRQTTPALVIWIPV